MRSARTRYVAVGVVVTLVLFFLLGEESGVTVSDLRHTKLPHSFLHQEEQSSATSPSSGAADELHDGSTDKAAIRHPIDELLQTNQQQHKQKLAAQSKSLAAAVKEYRRRYGIPPPPGFDKWYKFATARSAQLIDEFDMIHDDLLPFWGLQPATIRSRVREAIGFENNAFIGMLIRNGEIKHMQTGQEWQQKATAQMMQSFVHYLPDMDLAFNLHDEPRVVIPHDDLSRLLQIAHGQTMARAAANTQLRKKFSSRPADVNEGLEIVNVNTTRFNEFAHQSTWLPSRLSCPPDSAARGLDDSMLADADEKYALPPLGLIYNRTAFTDVCNSPSLATMHGSFERPNAFKVVHELFPVFSQSKLSVYNDILYPSPWYYSENVKYNQEEDRTWDKKIQKLWWLGSTTGGYSRNGGWRRQHRQHLLGRINAKDDGLIMQRAQSAEGSDASWQAQNVSRLGYSDLMNAHFSLVSQCDQPDCDEQTAFFDIVPPQVMHSAWNYTYLLDIDGNAFSGRFYAFLKSHSQVFKMAVFREWHEEWIKPWVHYVPLSLKGDDVLESVRYFNAEPSGQKQAVAMAAQSRDWAAKTLRKSDLEVWFFRLLLE